MPRLGGFEAAYPQVDVWLSADMALVDFASTDVDLAIRYGAGPYPGLEVVRLMGESVLPVMSPELAAANPVAVPATAPAKPIISDSACNDT